MNYYAFDSSGNIVRHGDCDESNIHLYESSAYTIGIGLAYPHSHYVMGGNLLRYSASEALSKENKPPWARVWNNALMAWEDQRTLQDIKDEQWSLIKQARSQAEYSGFTWDGSTFDSDEKSQNRITGAVTLAQINPAFAIDWVLADNTTRTLGQNDMLQVGGALGTHVATQFAKGVGLRAQIDAATTKEAVEAVVW